ncbi:uncharacterized protein [Typha angustifolia]|uniref:uncharacterized protein isoform X2 n=1 Tax=Typha angustifolia TaxID=59011 RepID=UPI003C2B16D6
MFESCRYDTLPTCLLLPLPSFSSFSRALRTREIGEMDFEGDGKEPGWRRWVLPAAKKAAIAGAAVAAAPVVLPPALLLSAVGIAFSLPFGAYLAGVACTDKLMASLLPLPPQTLGDRGREEEETRSSFYRSIGAEAELSELGSEYASALEDRSSTDEDDKEVLYSEEKIWQQIESLRIVVGYKDTVHSSCVEELRALLLFTGVEPPPSFKDSSDLVEVKI